jgi:tetraacyldisaccharide 4'-kinase
VQSIVNRGCYFNFFKTMLICSPMYRVPRALAPFVFLPGLAFEALVRTRNRLYTSSAFPQRRISRPVISIGNITMGGTGKTPLVMHVARTLLMLGFVPAVLSRGYGRVGPGTSHVVPPGKDIPDPASCLGDEPALIRRSIPGVWMGISKNRFTIAGTMENPGAKMVFILDDGFQHRQFSRDLDIVIIDASQPLKSNRVFPRGALREPVEELRRCHAIVLNGNASPDDPAVVESELESLRLPALVFHCEQKIEALIPLDSWEKAEAPGTASRSDVRSAYLVAALGNPRRFLLDVQKLGINVHGARFFPDHHRLSREEWHACAKEAHRKNADAILTTEKDAIKISLPPEFPLLVATQSTTISESVEFENLLRSRIGEKSRS